MKHKLNKKNILKARLKIEMKEKSLKYIPQSKSS